MSTLPFILPGITAKRTLLAPRRSLLRAFSVALLLAAALILAPRAQGQMATPTPAPVGNIISYQGQLTNPNGTPVADGSQNATFAITQNGAAFFSVTQPVATVNGVFNTFLNIGSLAFDPAKSYALSITVGGNTATHPIAAVPVAVNAKSATTANSANSANSVSGVVPVANGGTGSSTQNFVDLSSTQTVGGTKTFSGALSAASLSATGAVNAGRQYNIGGDRVLSTAGARNIFVGVAAGTANTDGTSNTFIGTAAGIANTTGTSNVFIGNAAGAENVGGNFNAFLGTSAGVANTGSSNVAVGDAAGINLTGGNFNIALGNRGVAGDANTMRLGDGNQSRTFIAGIRDTTSLTGTLPVVVDANGQLGAGAALSSQFVDLSSAQTVGGAKNFTSPVNSTQYNIGGSRVLGLPGSNNLVVGPGAGGALTTGDGNTFLGLETGQTVDIGSNNTFVGKRAGNQTSGGAENVYLGANAGFNSVSGLGNTFVGTGAGNYTPAIVSGGGNENNIALGRGAGADRAFGSNNIHIGNPGLTENNTIRIGAGNSVHTRFFVAGVNSVAVPGGTQVFIGSNSQLGTAISSSRRYKQDIMGLGRDSDFLLQLRPVSFRYTAAHLKADAPSAMQYGLIAEEVAQVAPQMVQFGPDGQAEGVKYGDLPIMLLNLVQQQQRDIAELRAQLAQLQAGRGASVTASETRLTPQLPIKP